eukprot:m.238512 g.238512  ORF g.238512 m.238512 type:complete len:269 (-) comp13313_c0_seq1:110-916(-)
MAALAACFRRAAASTSVAGRIFTQARSIHYAVEEHKSTPLAQFFPPKNIYDDIQVGRSWLARDLRVKSFEDLQKLWFVLLKERNMLLTLKYECQRLERDMPAPDRLRKVKKSMAAIKTVISERDLALEAAMETDAEKILELREARGIKTEEKHHPIKPMSEKEAKDLAGVDYPTRATKPHQPRRFLKRKERNAFRIDIEVARKRQHRAAKAAIRAEVATYTDQQLLDIVKTVRARQADGAIYSDFDDKTRLAMHEASVRKLDRGLRRV